MREETIYLELPFATVVALQILALPFDLPQYVLSIQKPLSIIAKWSRKYQIFSGEKNKGSE
jgi:hypothetical protein